MIVPSWATGPGSGYAPCPHSVNLGHLSHQVLQRGPDGASSFQQAVTLHPTVPNSATGSSSMPVSLEFSGALLNLRGKPTFQPVVESFEASSASSVLLWNGEVFGGDSVLVAPGESDTRAVFDALLKCEQDAHHPKTEGVDSASPPPRHGGITEFIFRCRSLLEGIEGPFATIFYASSFRLVIFARDPQGRRSLVLHQAKMATPALSSTSSETILSSVCGCHQKVEPPNGPCVPCLYDDSIALSGGSGARVMQPNEDLSQVRKAPRHEDNHRPSAHDGDEEDNQHGEVVGEGGGPAAASTSTCWIDVPTGGIFVVDFSSCTFRHGDLPTVTAQLVPWADQERGGLHPLLSARPHTTRAAQVKDTALVHKYFSGVGYTMNPQIDCCEESATRYLAALTRAVEKRVVAASRNSADIRDPVAVLFSGGIDSTILAALTHYVLPDLRTPIELINVAFGDNVGETPDRIASLHALEELRRHLINGWGREWRYVTVDVSLQELALRRSTILDLVFPSRTVMDHNIGSAIYFASRGMGLLHQAPKSLTSDVGTAAHKHFRVAQPPSAPPSAPAGSSSAPHGDRYKALVDVLITELVSGCDAVPLSTLGKEYRASLAEAWQAAGHKKLGHFISDAARDGVVRWGGGSTSKSVSLCRPEDLERAKMLQDQRAEFAVMQNAGAAPYHCQSKVLILGMGADETLGGYVRYQRVFTHSGMSVVKQEMQRDFCRLWERNLGRDDRCTSDSGREGRFPFLDEEVLRVLRGIPDFSDVCCVTLGPGVGDKRILRTCARMIGLQEVSRLQKRAIQFGTRIADRKQHGSSRIPGAEDE